MPPAAAAAERNTIVVHELLRATAVVIAQSWSPVAVTTFCCDEAVTVKPSPPPSAKILSSAVHDPLVVSLSPVSTSSVSMAPHPNTVSPLATFTVGAECVVRLPVAPVVSTLTSDTASPDPGCRRQTRIAFSVMFPAKVTVTLPLLRAMVTWHVQSARSTTPSMLARSACHVLPALSVTLETVEPLRPMIANNQSPTAAMIVAPVLSVLLLVVLVPLPAAVTVSAMT